MHLRQVLYHAHYVIVQSQNPHKKPEAWAKITMLTMSKGSQKTRSLGELMLQGLIQLVSHSWALTFVFQ